LQSHCRLLQGDLSAAAALAQDSLRLSEEIESALSIALSATYLASALNRQRRFGEALSLAERAAECGMRSCRTNVSEALAAIAVAQFGHGNHAAAAEAAERAVLHADSVDLEHQRVVARLAAARVAAADGGAAVAAAAQLDEAEQIVELSGIRSLLPEIWEIRAMPGLSGDRTRLDCLQRARALHSEFASPLQVARIDELLAEFG